MNAFSLPFLLFAISTTTYDFTEITTIFAKTTLTPAGLYMNEMEKLHYYSSTNGKVSSKGRPPSFHISFLLSVEWKKKWVFGVEQKVVSWQHWHQYTSEGSELVLPMIFLA